MSVAWEEIFDNFGVKTVARTDKNKSAYVPNQSQRAAIEAAGHKSGSARPAPTFDVTVLFDHQIKSVKASYYYSERSTSANRAPEPRMGHAIISNWLNESDKVVIGNIGTQLFAVKSIGVPISIESITQEVVKRADKKTIFDRARLATGKPKKRTVQRDDFVRNPYVVAAAIIRSNGKCEMPGCACELFYRDDGIPYLEVHHVDSLGQGGDDSLSNVAAICPHCHREMHFGKNRKKRLEVLKAHISSIWDL